MLNYRMVRQRGLHSCFERHRGDCCPYRREASTPHSDPSHEHGLPTVHGRWPKFASALPI